MGGDDLKFVFGLLLAVSDGEAMEAAGSDTDVSFCIGRGLNGPSAFCVSVRPGLEVEVIPSSKSTGSTI